MRRKADRRRRRFQVTKRRFELCGRALNKWTLALLVASVLLVSAPALAAACQSSTTYHAYQTSVNGFYGVSGYITDPGGSFVQGNTDNYNDEQHLVAYLNMINENPGPNHPCGGGNLQCWVEVGLAMGIFRENTDCTVPAPPPLSERWNYTPDWEIFFEDIGAGGTDNCYDQYYTGNQWSISQNTQIEFTVTYDGGTGYTGQPQFQAFAQGMYVNEGELYSTIDHAKASSEAYTGTTDTCPYLTYGPPYLHFGTDINGNFGNGEYELLLQPQPQGYFTAWGGKPDTGQNTYPSGRTEYYWYDNLSEFPKAFQSNGPSSAPK